MSKHKHEEQELPFVALMDTMTNVVGVLIIVMVMVGISLASAVNKILSDLPPVTKEEYEKMVQQIKQLPPIPADPKELDEKQKIAELELKKITDELSKIDTDSVRKNFKIFDPEEFRLKLAEAKALREKGKGEIDKLLEEIEKLKAALDDVKIPPAEPPTYVRLPNPRPYPEKPDETRVLVAKQGVLTLNDQAFLKPILEGLDKSKSQFEYKEVKIDPFMPMLTKVFGAAPAAQQAWPEMAHLVNTFQMDQVAEAYKILAAAGLQPNKNVLAALGDVSIATPAPFPALAEAVVAATKGDFAKWLAFDTSKDPTNPKMKATAAGSKITFMFNKKTAEVKNTPKDILAYFTKDLADLEGVKNRSRARVIYDAFKLVALLERAASNPSLTGAFAVKPTIKPGSTLVQLALTPRAGETLEQMRAEGSAYQRLMRQIKGDPNGVAVFQVTKEGFNTYVEARKIADNIGVPATWDFLADLNQTMNVAGYEVQRFDVAPKAAVRPPGSPDPVTIAKPKKSLD